jgi:hypothetical protein
LSFEAPLERAARDDVLTWGVALSDLSRSSSDPRLASRLGVAVVAQSSRSRRAVVAPSSRRRRALVSSW